MNRKMYDYGTAPSVIRALFAYGLEQARIVGEENVYDYSLGNPSIPAPELVNETIEDLARNFDSIRLHGYSVAAGHIEARQAIADNLSSRFHIDARPERLFITCGCAPALVATAKTLTESAEDEIVVFAPYFPEYNLFLTSGGARLNVVPANAPSFQIDAGMLEEHINEHTIAVVINSPNNPSGVIYPEETIRSIAVLLRDKSEEYGHPIYIIADEPYRELVYDGARVPFIPDYYDNTIVCYSWSKSLSLPGERIGYAFVPDSCENVDEIYYGIVGASREIGSVCPPVLMQRVIERCVGQMPDLEAYDENRTLLYNELTAMGYEAARPQGAFYLFVRAPGGDAKAFSDRAKYEHNLLVVPGDGFACPGYMRLSYCVSNDMIRRSLPAFRAMIGNY